MVVFFLIISFVFLILFPSTSFDGAKNGLMLWFQVVLPTIFPFLIVTNLMEKLLPLKSGRMYTIITGLLSGYPVGAKSCRHMVEQNKITKKEGQFLLSFCNNASPAFLLNYVFIQCLQIGNVRFFLLFIFYLSAFLSAMIIFPKEKTIPSVISISENQGKKLPSFDDVIMNSFEIVTKIGGYIILFSLLANIIRVHSPFPEPLKILSCGILEITTGIRILSNSVLPASMKLLLGMFIVSFGGLSALFQTKSTLGNTLSIKTYGLLKILHGLICVILTSIFTNFLFHIF